MNLYDTFKATAETYPDKIAVIYKDTHLSYRDLLKKVDLAAAGFHGLGLKKGDRIGLMMQNCPEFIVCFYAAMKLGLISVSINIMFKRHEVEYILKDSGMMAIILNRSFLSSVVDYDDQKIPMSAFYALTFYESTLLDILPYESLQKNSSVLSIADLSPGDPAVIAYTSGTTGFPKGAVHSHENILMHLTGIRDHLHFHEGDVFLAALPFFQLVAFLIHVGISVLVAGKLLILEKFDAELFMDFLRKEKATFFAAVPTIYGMLYDIGQKMKCDMSSVRFGICAGSPLTPELRSKFEDAFDFRIIHCYGLTEISLIAACENPAVPAIGVSVGKALPYITMRIVGEKNIEAPPDTVGNIEIGAERALNHYWNNPSETQHSIRDGWFDTGDMGYCDTDGNLHVVDRRKDMIIRGGFNIYPAELERILFQDKRVAEAAVIGVSHDRLGEIPKAFIVLKEGIKADEEDIRAVANNSMANYKAIERIEIVAPSFFTRNALGKILKRALRE